jgi:leucyl/phenylalanyl-tRNA--protein transferase
MLPITPRLLLSAYAAGIFPMAEERDSDVVHWIEPQERGVIPLDTFHIPRRLRRTFRQRPFEISADTDFAGVISTCAEAVPDRQRTWLNDDLIGLYIELHRAGHAHSIECRQDGRLVGGLYGVSLGAAFFGESMFSRERDASKLALVELVGRLRAGGYRLLDAQFVTSHLERFGAIEVPRPHYRRLLAAALTEHAVFPVDPAPYGLGVVGPAAKGGSIGSRQSTTQTS